MTRKVSLAHVVKSYASLAAALKLPGIDQGGAMAALADRFGSASGTLLDAAVDLYLDDSDFDIDRSALISPGPDGTWVNAWVWVPDAEVSAPTIEQGETQ
jgi:hypothetical protein